jgi:hypothetical protein
LNFNDRLAHLTGLVHRFHFFRMPPDPALLSESLLANPPAAIAFIPHIH